jgi:hypothetical protein
MEYKRISGLIAFVLVAMMAISSGFSYVGNVIEQAIHGLSLLLTFLVVIGLFGIWREMKLFKENEITVIAIAYPLVTLMTYIYPLIEYSEQIPPSNWWFTFSVDLIVALFISHILWRNK